MSDYTIKRTTSLPFEKAENAIREELAAVGFGILTEIDMAATLKTKLDVDIPPRKILGACNPAFAHRVTQAEPSITALLPCSVVVNYFDDHTTELEAFDPKAMLRIAAVAGEVESVADEVQALLTRALDAAAAR